LIAGEFHQWKRGTIWADCRGGDSIRIFPAQLRAGLAGASNSAQSRLGGPGLSALRCATSPRASLPSKALEARRFFTRFYPPDSRPFDRRPAC
jgi:hypothetical protein